MSHRGHFGSLFQTARNSTSCKYSTRTTNFCTSHAGNSAIKLINNIFMWIFQTRNMMNKRLKIVRKWILCWRAVKRLRISSYEPGRRDEFVFGSYGKFNPGYRDEKFPKGHQNTRGTAFRPVSDLTSHAQLKMFRPGIRAGVFILGRIRKISSSVPEISVTGPARLLIWTHPNFCKEKSGEARSRKPSQPGKPGSYEEAIWCGKHCWVRQGTSAALCDTGAAADSDAAPLRCRT